MLTVTLRSDIPTEEELIDQSCQLSELRDRLDGLYVTLTEVLKDPVEHHHADSIASVVIDTIRPFCSDEVTNEPT